MTAWVEGVIERTQLSSELLELAESVDMPISRVFESELTLWLVDLVMRQDLAGAPHVHVLLRCGFGMDGKKHAIRLRRSLKAGRRFALHGTGFIKHQDSSDLFLMGADAWIYPPTVEPLP
jgi:hypothetical protein